MKDTADQVNQAIILIMHYVYVSISTRTVEKESHNVSRIYL